jgi:spoIIIJ-associated protein
VSETDRAVEELAPELRARQILLDIVERMGLRAEVVVHDEEDRYRLEVDCDQPEVLVGKRGQVLDALQHLVGKILFRGRALGEDGVPGKPIVIDAAGYRERHAEKLRGLAARMADRVEQSGRLVELDPMSAHDRRIIHLALRDRPGVVTRSEGEGEDRHLLIVPAEAASAAGETAAE